MKKRDYVNEIDHTVNCFLCLQSVKTHERCVKCSRLIHKEFFVEDLERAPRCLKTGTICYDCACAVLKDYGIIKEINN